MLYTVEGAGGEIMGAYRLCGCASEGATPQPIVSIFPNCRVSVRGGEHICAQHLAERDASVAVEDWQHAEKVLEAMAEAMRVIGLPHVDEAIQDALAAAKGSHVYYADERDRLRGRG